ncbi:extracellular solute-binding protein [Paracoccus seriniphilus]|uniref:Microcin C transport system substrate-binding protein n=1 Tax=Paracoccus seriniphilus TaxID=184748 RepID=A0A239Q2P0_9RHOB|nr:extracellular solute-binding protein [Paracoccus seriniphilus]WCR13270.1 ABC transporter substrate-binding protein [Paracoccus seriniphilus]SNT76473.1 microcin C transport system substrate-binding protein [Paracoccus seriniphilus]
MRPFALIALLATIAGGPALAQEDRIIAHGIGVFDELKLPPDFDHLPYVNPDAPKGGELSEAIPNSTGFDNYNPFTFRGRAAVLSSIMLESILTGTADEVGAAYCLLCESIEYPRNRDWVIFHLRPEARFSDGTPLTANDVLFSYETLRDKGLSSFRLVIGQQVSKAEVIDDHTIKFTFTPDYPRRDVIQSVGSLPIFSRKDFVENDRDLEATMETPMIGSGPYMFDSAEINRKVIYRRNPDYWGKDLPINRGRHNFDRIRFEYFSDYDAAFEAFKAGEYAFRREVSSIIWATRYNFPALEKGWVVKETLPDGQIASGQAWVLNLRRPDWQDIRVRQAIGLMFNFEWSNDALFYGLYDRVDSFWDNSDLEASGPPDEGELELLEPLAKDLPEGILTQDAVTAPVSGPRQLDRKNLRKASKLLDEAGWTVADDGKRRNAQGRQLSIEILNDSQTFDRVINPFVQNLQALGVDARNVRVDNAEYENRKRSHDFDLISDHLGQDEIPGSGLQQYFGSANVGDVFNPMGLANPAIDALITQVEEAETKDELTTRVHALDRALRSLRFWIPQWYNANHLVAYYDQYGRPETLPPYALGEMDFWWYDADKAKALRDAGALR